MDSQSNVLRFFSRQLMCPSSGIAYASPEPNSFSFNSPKGACSGCNGLGEISKIDVQKILPNKNLSINKGAIAPIAERNSEWILKQLEIIGKKFNFDLTTPIKDISKKGIDSILFGINDSFQIEMKNLGLNKIYNINFEGIINFLEEQYKNSSSPKLKRWASEYMNKVNCRKCNGSRLNKEAQYFKIDDKNISEVAQMDILSLKKWLQQLESKLSNKQRIIAKEILKELNKRVQFLIDVGLNYLNLNRSAKTLSGGESQRIRLATQIGSQLTDVLYILDEPSIGLHQRDNQKLIQSLKELRDVGNSVIVVEHDKDMILEADYVLDLGPGAGIHGGNIIAKGTSRFC